MILSRKYGIAIILAVIIFIPNVCAIKMSVSSGNGVSYSGDYCMATSASLQNNILLGGEGIFQDTKASGKGKNAIIQSIGGNGYNGESSLVTSGSFSISSSSVVTSNAGMISQDVSADGDASIGATASTATGTAVQQAGVNNGALSSSQNLAMGDSAIASQNTAIVGDSGSIDSSALSQGNQAETVNGYFIGGGYLDSQLASMSGQGSGMQGTASINGMEVINSEILQELESGEVEMQIDGLSYYDLIRLGYFSVSATNTVSASTKLAPALPTVQGQGTITKDGSNPEIVDSPLGNANSYRLNMGKINQAKPIQLFLRKDSYLTNEGLDSSAGAQAISRAANTWDYWTKPSQNNLFQPAVVVDSSKKVDTRDGYSVNAFTPISSSLLAYARTWYSGNYLSEVDVCYNTNYQWTTDWDKAQSSNKAVIDLQTVALHELGHGIGLLDLYNLPQGDVRRGDHYAIMNNYDAPQHNLGAGDIAAIRAIYGK